jgi:hypothetical protein
LNLTREDARIPRPHFLGSSSNNENSAKFTDVWKTTVQYLTETNNLEIKANRRYNKRKGETKKERKTNREFVLAFYRIGISKNIDVR